ncbi:MAG: hypothetical protein JSU74_02245 [Candidatus Zixiibacteriota bacterium]|nr:MAG: hypothetical protein JSU74_02245 [candidate division Zixibacteria bacterium]
MRKYLPLLACVLGLILLFAHAAMASEIFPTLIIRSEFPEKPARGGQVTMLLYVSPEHETEQEPGPKQLNVSAKCGLKVMGYEALGESETDNDELSFAVKMWIPDRDTSMVVVSIHDRRGLGMICRTFITIGDTLEIYEIGQPAMRKIESERRQELFDSTVKEATDTFSDSRSGGKVVANVNYVSKDANTARLEQCTQLRAPGISNEVHITLAPFNGARVQGDTSWTQYYPPGTYQELAFRHAEHTRWYDVAFPSNDTSGLVMTFVYGPFEQKTRITFATTGDTTELWLGRPEVQMPMYRSPRTDASLVEKYPYFFGDQFRTRGYKIKLDSATIHQHRLETQKRKMFELISELEQHACTTGCEIVVTGNQIWIRDQGQSIFHSVKESEQSECKATVVLDLPKPSDYDFASKLVPHLVRAEQTGSYRATVPADIIWKLIDHGIIVFGRTESSPPTEPGAVEGRRRERIVVRMDPGPVHEYLERMRSIMRPMEREGFYHLRVPAGMLPKLDKLGIPYAIYPEYPDSTEPKSEGDN